MWSHIVRSIIAMGLASLVAATGASAATPSDGLPGLILAAETFVADQCPGLSVDEGLGSDTLRTAGFRTADTPSPGLRTQIASWLTEWRGNPKAACDGLLAQFGPDGRMVRNLIRRTRKGA